MRRRDVEASNRARAKRVAATMAIVELLVLSPASHAASMPRRLHLHGGVGMGYDNNAYRLNRSGDGGAFVSYTLGADQFLRWGAATRLLLAADATGPAYFEPVPAARGFDYHLKADVTRRLAGGRIGRVGSRTLDVHLGSYLRSDYSIWISKKKGHELVRQEAAHDGLPQHAVTLGDRYCYREYGSWLGFDLRFPRRTRWSIQYQFTRRNFLDDCRSVGLSPLTRLVGLDFDASIASATIQQDLRRGVAAEAGYEREKQDFPRRPPRDFDGNYDVDRDFRPRVDSQQFDFDRIHGVIAWSRPRRGRAAVRVEASHRYDTYFGYLDRHQILVTPEVHVQAGDRFEVGGSFSYLHSRYPNAHLDLKRAHPLRARDGRGLFLEALFRTSRHTTFYARHGYDNVDDRDPAFTYDRARTWVGCEFFN